MTEYRGQSKRPTAQLPGSTINKGVTYTLFGLEDWIRREVRRKGVGEIEVGGKRKRIKN